MIILSSISHQGMKHIWWWSMHHTTCREQHPLTPPIPCIVHLAHWFTENHQLIHDLLHPLGLQLGHEPSTSRCSCQHEPMTPLFQIIGGGISVREGKKKSQEGRRVISCNKLMWINVPATYLVMCTLMSQQFRLSRDAGGKRSGCTCTSRRGRHAHRQFRDQN